MISGLLRYYLDYRYCIGPRIYASIIITLKDENGFLFADNYSLDSIYTTLDNQITSAVRKRELHIYNDMDDEGYPETAAPRAETRETVSGPPHL